MNKLILYLTISEENKMLRHVEKHVGDLCERGNKMLSIQSKSKLHYKSYQFLYNTFMKW